MEKQRADVRLAQLGLTASREQAKNLILEGKVFVKNRKIEKPSELLEEEELPELRGERLPYVSRGGLKLEKAVQCFALHLKDKIAMDIGASTGGFTDCMLQNGAKKVYAVDVGTSQLDARLLKDPRVVNMEQTNVRYLTREQIPDVIDFFTVDVSFISLRLVLPVGYALLKEGGEAVCLLKPQFEAGKNRVGKKGVVKDPRVHEEILRDMLAFVNQLGFWVRGVDFSPIQGPEGNIEYLLYLQKSNAGENISVTPASVVRMSHAVFDRKH